MENLREGSIFQYSRCTNCEVRRKSMFCKTVYQTNATVFPWHVFCYIDKQYTKFSFLVSAGIFFAWGEGGGNRRILVMSRYNLPDLLIGLCNIFMIPLSLSTPHSQFSTVPLYTLTPPVSHEYVWPSPPRPKKNRLQVTNDYFLRYPQFLISNVPHLLIQLIQPRPSSLP